MVFSHPSPFWQNQLPELLAYADAASLQTRVTALDFAPVSQMSLSFALCRLGLADCRSSLPARVKANSPDSGRGSSTDALLCHRHLWGGMIHYLSLTHYAAFEDVSPSMRDVYIDAHL